MSSNALPEQQIPLDSDTFFKSANLMNVYPPCWWVGMKNPNLQLMIHAKDVGKGNLSPAIKYPGIQVIKMQKVTNPNYIFGSFH